MADLSEPYSPDVLDPVPHTPPAGNTRDDDGQVIDDLFEPNPNPPTPPLFQDHLVPDLGFDDGPSPTTRLITRALTIGQPVGTDRAIVPIDPIQVFPADAKRKFLRLRIGYGGEFTWRGTNPAAGANYASAALAFPGFFLNAYYVVATDATVASRVPTWQIVNGAGVAKHLFGPISTIAASGGNTIYYEPVGAGSTAAGLLSAGPVVPIAANPGDILRDTVLNIQAGDQLSAITFTERTHLWRVAGERSECFGAADLLQEAVWESDCHTGPVWVYAPYSVGECQLIAESVSS